MKHNVYHEGKVQSLSFQAERGPGTVGVITPGHYSFTADTRERVVIVSGTLKVKLSPDAAWLVVHPTESYEVPTGRTFEVEAVNDVAYVCFYG